MHFLTLFKQSIVGIIFYYTGFYLDYIINLILISGFELMMDNYHKILCKTAY